MKNGNSNADCQYGGAGAVGCSAGLDDSEVTRKESAIYRTIINKIGGKKMKVFYEDVLVGEVVASRSMTVEEALEIVGFNEQEFIAANGFEDIDYNDFRTEY